MTAITSLAALAQVGVCQLRLRVYAFIAERGPHGATDDECQTSLDMNPSTQRPRRIELVGRKLVHDSGKTRPTRSGRQATVWIAVSEN